MTPDQAGVILAEIVAAWPNPAMPTIVMEAWVEVIEPLDYLATRHAVKELIKSRTYRPTPVELEDAARPVSLLQLVEYVPTEVEGVLPPAEQLARIHQIRASLKRIDALDEHPGQPA